MDKPIDVIQFMFAFCDVKAAAFGPPFLANTKGEAMRTFDHLVNDNGKGSMISQYPEDFILYQLGSFNMSKGTVIPNVIEHVAKGIDFVKAVPVPGSN